MRNTVNMQFQNDNDFNNTSSDTQNEKSGFTQDSGSGHISYTPSENGVYNYSIKDTIPNEPSTTRRVVLLISLLLAGIFLLIGGIIIGAMLKAISNHPKYSESFPSNGTVNIVNNRPAIETKPVNYNDRTLLSVSDIAAAVSASVVEIKTESAVYNNFYGSYVSEGAGSGVIITDSGFIITNHHVIDEASTITVKLNNGNEYPAELIGSDAESDIAVISITAIEELSPAYLGTSSSLIVGENIVVIGNPLGSLGGSVTNGIISALGRDIIIDGNEMTLIQTNAAVNPGNSGGGMFNMYGELVGIINAKSSGENIEGIGFAIPIDHAFNISSQLIEYGYVRGKVDHGLTLIEINDFWDMAKYNVSNTGVYIFSSAYSTELKNGDLIKSINGIDIKKIDDIKSALRSNKVGDSINVTVYRGKYTISINLTLREYTPKK